MQIINWEPQKGSRYHKTVAHAKAGARNWAGETNICPPSISGRHINGFYLLRYCITSTVTFCLILPAVKLKKGEPSKGKKL